MGGAARQGEERSGDAERRSKTAHFLVRAKQGDEAALEALVRRHIAVLTRLAHGRIPARARGQYETQDLVQETYERAIRNLAQIEPGGPGAFLGYLRKILLNRLHDLHRSASRRPSLEPLPDEIESPQSSPPEVAALRERMENYQRALSTLPAAHQDAVRMRLELGMSYAQIADALGSASPNAVRMQIVRALAKVAAAMSEPED